MRRVQKKNTTEVIAKLFVLHADANNRKKRAAKNNTLTEVGYSNQLPYSNHSTNQLKRLE